MYMHMCLFSKGCDKEGDDGVQKVTLNCEGCAEDRWEHRQIFFTCLVKSGRFNEKWII